MSTAKIVFIVLSLIILVACVAFFSSSETAYLSLRRLKIRRMKEERVKHAAVVERLWNNMDTLLTTVLIGTNFVNSLASSLATVLAIAIVGHNGVGVATLIISFFITVFGQIVPKTIASLYPEKVASIFGVGLSLLEKIFFPVIWLFTQISHGAVILAEKFLKPDTTIVTEEEIQKMIEVGGEEGTIEKRESQMLNKIFSFNDLDVKDIMRHRSFIIDVSENASEEEVIDTFLKSGYSTIAVRRDEKNGEEGLNEILGVLNYQKVLFESEADHEDGQSPENAGFARRLMTPVLYVPQTMSVFELLQLFRSQEHHFAVALDENGCTAGLVTIKDIMRRVFGRMSDENGIEEVPAENRIKVLSSNEFLVPGDIKIEEINNLLNIRLESEDFLTLGGWVLEKIGHLPSSGDYFVFEKNVFMVEEVSQRRIISVRVKFK